MLKYWHYALHKRTEYWILRLISANEFKHMFDNQLLYEFKVLANSSTWITLPNKYRAHFHPVEKLSSICILAVFLYKFVVFHFFGPSTCIYQNEYSTLFVYNFFTKLIRDLSRVRHFLETTFLVRNLSIPPVGINLIQCKE